MTETLEQKVARRQTCFCCKRRFQSIAARKQHERAYRTRRNKERDDPSMAELFVEGELNRAMGIKNPDWLEDMLPKI